MTSEPQEEARSNAPQAETGPRFPSYTPLLLAILAPVLFFLLLPPLSRSGLWDPYELNVADLARRIGLNLFHADALALSGADNSLPHLNDLGRPELPFTSIALGFKLFGLHEWAGRLPLAVWGIAGVLTTFGVVRRLVDARAAVYAAVVLTSTPLYFVQARTMLGDVVTMSAFAMAFGGLCVVVIDDEKGPARFAWLALALLGLVSGYYSRGLLLGVGVPLAAIGLVWLVSLGAGQRAGDTLSAVVALAGLAVAVFAGWRAVAAIRENDTKNLSMAIGAMLHLPSKYPTFDYFVGYLGHAAAPWSAFVPFALGRLFIPPIGREGAAHKRESLFRMALLIGVSTAFVGHGFLAAHTELLAFSAPAALAAVCAVSIRDFERGAHGSVAVGVGTGVLLGVFHHDFHELPEKAYNAFGVLSASFPESYKDRALALWWVSLFGFAGIAFLTWVERDSKRRPFDPKNYLGVLYALRDAWDGLLALVYFALVAGASLAGLAIWAGTRFHAKWLPTISLQVRDGVLNAWWITAFVPPLVILGIFFACDLWLWAFARARPLSVASLTRGFEPFEELFGDAADTALPGAGTTSVDAEAKKEADAKREDGDAKTEGDAKKDAAKPATKPEERGMISILPSLALAALTGGRVGSPPKSLFVKDEGLTDRGREVLASAFLLFPMMGLALPALIFLGATAQHLRWTVAAALGLPSGIAMFLVLGLLGDLLQGRRAAAFALSGAAAGFVLCFWYYPALANQLSPKEVFESYETTHQSGEPLGLFGVGGRTAAYYAGGEPASFTDTGSAYRWLMEAPSGKRRYLAMRADELARLNAMFREHAQPRTNLPVLDARSSQILLVASALLPGEKNQNPLDKILLDGPPKPHHALDVNMEDKLQVLGYDITDGNGKMVSTVAPGRKYRMRTYYKVLAPITTEWEAFIHIDGFRRRHNGDHKPLEGKYPFALWLTDDYIVDDYEFQLEPNFTPGSYTIYFGLFVGETRLKVKSGPSDGENRVIAGALHVQ